ncbi:MAG TPA: hypothetical protein VEW93_10565 [Acidimicrobiales bacterium]|nr:hypothetical protein [Acidimicrobiales bacterium]
MRVDVILADAAHAAEGKVSMLGAGWSLSRGVTAMAVVVFIEVPWDQTDPDRRFTLELLDADGQAVRLRGPKGTQTIIVEGTVKAERPADLPHGIPIALPPLALQIGPLPLEPGRYVWRFSLDGETHETWQRSFTKVAPRPEAQNG